MAKRRKRKKRNQESKIKKKKAIVLIFILILISIAVFLLIRNQSLQSIVTQPISAQWIKCDQTNLDRTVETAGKIFTCQFINGEYSWTMVPS